MAKEKQTFWANVRLGAEQHAYIELDQISKNRWKATIDSNEYIIRCTSTDFFEVLNEAVSTHLRHRTP